MRRTASMRAYTRIGVAGLALVLLRVLISFWTLDTRQQIKNVNVGSEYVNGLLRWAAGDDGVQMVVFGDSWVDNSEVKGVEGGGESWVESLCEMLECSSSLNFATSQPLTSDPASSPTGALVSNQIYLSNASALPNSAPPSKAVDLLPDLAAQIQEYINLPPTKFRPTKTYYVVSFGLWNIYHTAGLDIKVASNITDLSVSEIFKQLDILQNHVVQNLTENLAREIGLQKREEQEEDETFETLKVILPKLFDPSLLPGWFTQRPRPLAPSSIAEQQRNSITLTGRWNDRLEAEMPQWLFASDHDAKPLQGKGHNGKDIERWEVHTNIKRDIYFPEVPAHLLSLITENQVQSIGISDASGVGTREDISEHVSTPCVTDSLEDGQASWSFGGLPELQEGRKERDGKMVCKHPDKYLFWDAWTLGRKAKEQVAEMVKGIVVEERGMRSLLEEGMDSEDGEE